MGYYITVGVVVRFLAVVLRFKTSGGPLCVIMEEDDLPGEEEEWCGGGGGACVFWSCAAIRRPLGVNGCG